MKALGSVLKLFIIYYLLFIISSCNRNPAKPDNSLKKYFDENNVDGCFTMYNNSNGEVTVYNLAMDTTRYSPASTFKIVNSLIGLQTGAIVNDSMVIKWDGKKRMDAWDKDMNMTEAFKASCVPYYQEVARRIGKDTMQKWVDKISYGNKNLAGPVDSFWLNRNLTISPDEQLGLIKKMYFSQLPFSKYPQETVKKIMVQENNTAYQFAYKTGWGFDAGKPIGWVVGWIEENKHVYFFVTFVKSDNPGIDMQAVRMNITKGILKHYGFFEGKK